MEEKIIKLNESGNGKIIALLNHYEPDTLFIYYLNEQTTLKSIDEIKKYFLFFSEDLTSVKNKTISIYHNDNYIFYRDYDSLYDLKNSFLEELEQNYLSGEIYDYYFGEPDDEYTPSIGEQIWKDYLEFINISRVDRDSSFSIAIIDLKNKNIIAHKNSISIGDDETFKKDFSWYFN